MMTERAKLKRAEKIVWWGLRILYNKGYLISLEQEQGGYRFAFWRNKLHKPKKELEK